MSNPFFSFPPNTPKTFNCHGWRFLMARIFGKKIETMDGPWHSVAYYWRGMLYWKTLERLG